MKKIKSDSHEFEIRTWRMTGQQSKNAFDKCTLSYRQPPIHLTQTLRKRKHKRTVISQIKCLKFSSSSKFLTLSSTWLTIKEEPRLKILTCLNMWHISHFQRVRTCDSLSSLKIGRGEMFRFIFAVLWPNEYKLRLDWVKCHHLTVHCLRAKSQVAVVSTENTNFKAKVVK
jgi:hypothetical protein